MKAWSDPKLPKKRGPTPNCSDPKLTKLQILMASNESYLPL